MMRLIESALPIIFYSVGIWVGMRLGGRLAEEACTEKMNAYREAMVEKMELQEEASNRLIAALLEEVGDD